MRSAGEFQFNQTKFLSHSFKKKIYISFLFFFGIIGIIFGKFGNGAAGQRGCRRRRNKFRQFSAQLSRQFPRDGPAILKRISEE